MQEPDRGGGFLGFVAVPSSLGRRSTACLCFLHGGAWLCMVVYGSVWWCMVVYYGVLWCIMVYGAVWWCMVLSLLSLSVSCVRVAVSL